MRLDRTERKIFKDLEEVNNLECLITEPTRTTAHSETILDVILTNNTVLFKKCGTHQPEMSNHHLVFGEMTETVHKHKTRTVTFRQTKSTDFYDYWKGLFESIVDKHAPIKRKRVTEKDTPSMTPECKQAIRDKRKFAILFVKNRTPENFELKRKCRNIATSDVGRLEKHTGTGNQKS